MRPNSLGEPATVNSPKRIRNQRVTTGKNKGEKTAPNLVVADKGHAAKLRLYARANTDYYDLNRSWTVTWLRHRLREYVNIHGYASAGVCALLERAAEQYADGDYLRASSASESGGPIDPDKFAERLHQAARHAQLARSHELAAWELASREGSAKKQLDSAMGNRNGKLSLLIREKDPDAPRPKEGEWGGVGAEELEQLPVGDEVPPERPADPRARNRTPVPPFAPPGGVEGRGTLSSPQPPKTKSAAAGSKPPMFDYCRVHGHYRIKKGIPICKECEKANSRTVAAPISESEEPNETTLPASPDLAIPSE